MNLKKYIRSIPDYPKKGILFRDISTLIKDEKAFAESINQIVERSKNFKLEYGTATIEVHKDSIGKDDSVLIIDDLIATGGTAEAAAKLVEISGGKIAAFIFAINLFDLNGSDNLVRKGYQVENLMDFPGH
jgi:adenine phosphoribosyltransferase